MTATAVTVTDQDRAILELMALGESQNYNTVFGRNLTRPLTQMTLREVERDMQARIDGMPGYPRGYSASGKYQFIRTTFIATVDTMGLDWDNVRWTPDVQDAMAIQLLVGRGYRRWLNNEISTEQFQLNLSKEWASVPVPFDTNGKCARVPKGYSYYEFCPTPNRAKDQDQAPRNADRYLAALESIKNGGTGRITELDVAPAGRNGAQAAEGETPLARAQAVASGGGSPHTVRSNAPFPGAGNLARGNLPGAEQPYVYEPIDPLDDRYDFRTGKKIKDILINGTLPQSRNAITTSSTAGELGTGQNQTGTGEERAEGQTEVLAGIPEDAVARTEAIDTPDGPQQVTRYYRTVDTPAGPQEVIVNVPPQRGQVHQVPERIQEGTRQARRQGESASAYLQRQRSLYGPNLQPNRALTEEILNEGIEPVTANRGNVQ